MELTAATLFFQLLRLLAVVVVEPQTALDQMAVPVVVVAVQTPPLVPLLLVVQPHHPVKATLAA
jgi:hypothetical protein